LAARVGQNLVGAAATAAEVTRTRQPRIIRVVGEDQLVALDRVDDFARDLWTQRGTTVAASQPALTPGLFGVHVGRAVDHDQAVAGIVIHARLQPVHPQRIAVAADVGFGGAEQ